MDNSILKDYVSIVCLLVEIVPLLQSVFLVNLDFSLTQKDNVYNLVVLELMKLLKNVNLVTLDVLNVMVPNLMNVSLVITDLSSKTKMNVLLDVKMEHTRILT